MDPNTIATTLATLVSLICNFRQERGARDEATHTDFMEWLSNHRHNEIRDLIANTYHLQTEVDDLLRADHTKLLLEVERANSVLADVLRRLDDFRGIVDVIRPATIVSDQAVTFLRYALESEYGGIGMQRQKGGTAVFCFRYGEFGPGIPQSDPLFAEDDINTLTELGFLHLITSGDNLHWFKVTRTGARFLKSIEQNEKIRKV